MHENMLHFNEHSPYRIHTASVGICQYGVATYDTTRRDVTQALSITVDKLQFNPTRCYVTISATLYLEHDKLYKCNIIRTYHTFVSEFHSLFVRIFCTCFRLMLLTFFSVLIMLCLLISIVSVSVMYLMLI